MDQIESPSVVYQSCRKCKHEWVHYLGERQECIFCHSKEFTPPISLSALREASNLNETKFKDGRIDKEEYEERKVLIAERYKKAAPVFANRADELYPKIKERFLNGDLSDKVIDQLIFCFHLFHELGLHESAVAAGSLIGAGYAQRGAEREVNKVNDLVDLAGALTWFKNLKLSEWEATVNLQTAKKAILGVNIDAREKCILLQVGLIHLSKAQQYYGEKRYPELLSRIEKDIDRTNELLSSSLQAAGAVQAAEINAASREKQGQIIKDGLIEIANEISGLAVAVESGFMQLSGTIASGMYGMAQAIENHGGMVSAAITGHAMAISGAIYAHGKETKEGLSALGSKIGTSLKESSGQISKSMNTLGNTMALGVVGGAALHGLILDGTLRQIADTVTPQIKKGLENLKLIEAPTLKSEPTLIDSMVNKGLDLINPTIAPYGFKVEQKP